jgi:hypothetical protein
LLGRFSVTNFLFSRRGGSARVELLCLPEGPEGSDARFRRADGTNPNEPEATMIHVTAKAAAYIAARGGDLTLYSKTLSG